MMGRIAGAASLALLLALAAIPAMAAACGDGEICGLKNPEDLVRLGASRWALASRLARDRATPGGIYAVDLQGRTARVPAPDLSARPAAIYAGCPGPPAPTGLVTHGLSVRMKANGAGELLAVNHGGRQSIEVFDVRLGAAGPALTWRGCILLPDDVSANAVVALPGGGVAVTSFGAPSPAAAADLAAGRPSGFVVIWSPAAGWKRLPGSEAPGDNGIEASPDGRTLYVNGWGDGALHILSAVPGGPAPRTVPLGDFHPDNIHRGPDGRLVIAGQRGERGAILNCDSEPACPMGSMVVTYDARTQAVTPQVVADPTETFGAASTAVGFNGGYWLSSFQGDRLTWVHATPASSGSDRR